MEDKFYCLISLTMPDGKTLKPCVAEFYNRLQLVDVAKAEFAKDKRKQKLLSNKELSDETKIREAIKMLSSNRRLFKLFTSSNEGEFRFLIEAGNYGLTAEAMELVEQGQNKAEY